MTFRFVMSAAARSAEQRCHSGRVAEAMQSDATWPAAHREFLAGRLDEDAGR